MTTDNPKPTDTDRYVRLAADYCITDAHTTWLVAKATGRTTIWTPTSEIWDELVAMFDSRKHDVKFFNESVGNQDGFLYRGVKFYCGCPTCLVNHGWIPAKTG